MSEDYKPNSLDSMITRVLTRMDSQDEALARIERNTASGLEKFDKRVRTLEREKWKLRGLAAGASTLFVVIAEWAKSKLVGH